MFLEFAHPSSCFQAAEVGPLEWNERREKERKKAWGQLEGCAIESNDELFLLLLLLLLLLRKVPSLLTCWLNIEFGNKVRGGCNCTGWPNIWSGCPNTKYPEGIALGSIGVTAAAVRRLLPCQPLRGLNSALGSVVGMFQTHTNAKKKRKRKEREEEK